MNVEYAQPEFSSKRITISSHALFSCLLITQELRSLIREGKFKNLRPGKRMHMCRDMQQFTYLFGRKRKFRSKKIMQECVKMTTIFRIKKKQ